MIRRIPAQRLTSGSASWTWSSLTCEVSKVASDTDDTSDSDRPNDHEALHEARERARAAKREVRRELLHKGDVCDETKIRAAEVALDYRDLLIDYKFDLGEEKWDDVGVDWPIEIMGQQVERQCDRPGLGRGTETVARPAFVEVDGRRFYLLLKNLDLIWRALGFGAEVGEEELDTHMVGNS